MESGKRTADLIGKETVASYERRPLAASVQSDRNRKLTNIEHRTSNIELRMMYSVYFIKKA